MSNKQNRDRMVILPLRFQKETFRVLLPLILGPRGTETTIFGRTPGFDTILDCRHGNRWRKISIRFIKGEKCGDWYSKTKLASTCCDRLCSKPKVVRFFLTVELTSCHYFSEWEQCRRFTVPRLAWQVGTLPLHMSFLIHLTVYGSFVQLLSRKALKTFW